MDGSMDGTRREDGSSRRGRTERGDGLSRGAGTEREDCSSRGAGTSGAEGRKETIERGRGDWGEDAGGCKRCKKKTKREIEERETRHVPARLGGAFAPADAVRREARASELHWALRAQARQTVSRRSGRRSATGERRLGRPSETGAAGIDPSDTEASPALPHRATAPAKEAGSRVLGPRPSRRPPFVAHSSSEARSGLVEPQRGS